MEFNRIEQRCYTNSKDEQKAIEEIAREIDIANTAIIFLFVNGDYNLGILADAMKVFGGIAVMGCTTAGSIHKGTFKNEGISAIALPSKHFFATVTCFDNVSALSQETIYQKMQGSLKAVSAFMDSNEHFRWSKFCIQFIDGTSACEEKFTESINLALSYIPFIGGSAGDKLRFKKSFVFSNGKFKPQSSAIAFCATSLQIKPFFHQHFDASNHYLIVTQSDTENRCIHTLNGLPASEEYARQIGVTTNQLTPETFSLHPLIMEIEGEKYIRSIQKANKDGSLTFYCSISRGIILKVAQTQGIVSSLENKMCDITNEIGTINFVLGFNCLLRHIEMQEKNRIDEIEAIHRAMNLSGFNSYGEQFQSTHINQTFTAIAFGEEVQV